jgi:hypothetical protein
MSRSLSIAGCGTSASDVLAQPWLAAARLRLYAQSDPSCNSASITVGLRIRQSSVAWRRCSIQSCVRKTRYHDCNSAYQTDRGRLVIWESCRDRQIVSILVPSLEEWGWGEDASALAYYSVPAQASGRLALAGLGIASAGLEPNP